MTDIAVAAAGHGPALVLLHAFPLHGGMWRPQAVLDVECSLLTPDLPGFGRSQSVPPIPSLDGIAHALLAVLKRLGVERATVAGCSLGGYLAFALLRAAPGFVSGLALIDTRAGADSTAARERRYATIERVKREGVAFLRDEWPPSALSPVTLQQRPGVLSTLHAMIGEATPAGVIAAQHAMAERPDATSQLAAISVPSLVIHGLDDPIIPAAEGEQMARAIPGASFCGVQAAGHVPNMEEPNAVTHALRDLVFSRI